MRTTSANHIDSIGTVRVNEALIEVYGLSRSSTTERKLYASAISRHLVSLRSLKRSSKTPQRVARLEGQTSRKLTDYRQFYEVNCPVHCSNHFLGQSEPVHRLALHFGRHPCLATSHCPICLPHCFSLCCSCVLYLCLCRQGRKLDSGLLTRFLGLYLSVRWATFFYLLVRKVC